MMKHLYSILSLLCCILFLACGEEDTIEGLGDFDREEPTFGDIGSSSIQPQDTSVTFSYSLQDTIGGEIYEDESPDVKSFLINGSGSATIRSSISPFYAFEKNESNGDYYIVQAEVSVANENMYKEHHHYYKVPYGMSDSLTFHQAIYGYYMREMRVKYELRDKDGNVVGEFPVGHSPTPLTTIGSTTYISGFSWGISVQVRLGHIDDNKGSGIQASIAPTFSFDNKTVRNIEDMDVRNSSTDNAASYGFILNNLPNEGTYVPSSLPPPTLSVNTGTYHQEFIWRVPSTKDFQGNDTRFTLVQTVEVEYGFSHFLYKDIYYGHTLREDIRTVTYSSTLELLPPCRIPVGTVKVTNRNNGSYITQITLTKEGETEPITISKGSLAYGKSVETYLDVGKYKVEFKMGKTAKDVKTYTLVYDVAEISQDETLELFSDYDFSVSD